MNSPSSLKELSMRDPALRARYRVAFAFVAVLIAATTTVPRGAEDGEWRTYAGTNAGAKYSALDLIDKNNVKNLKIAWRQSAMPEVIRAGRSSIALPVNYQTTPVMVGNLLYLTASDGSVIALNPGTGAPVWSYVPPDLRPSEASAPNEPVKIIVGGRSANRGLAYWSDGKDARIVTITGRALVALDAKTGTVIPTFGTNGSIDLTKGFRRAAASTRWTSVPLIINDLVVLGGNATDTGGQAMPGDIRAYDVRSGKLVWKFNVIPDFGEYGNDSWLEDSYAYAGAGGVWGFMSADDELGYLYLATETPSAMGGGDFYGGKRPGNGLFAESLVCIDAKTGKRVWHFQAIHHGIWDWDFTSAPNLVDITVNGRKIKAIAEVSKQAFVYVLDRVTGQPVWPIEERPVPKGNVPSEWYSPTQPFPTKPPAFDQQGASIDDLIDFTPELRQEAIKILNQYEYGPLFTPPSVAANGKKGTVQMPGAAGGANWTGAGVDPETGILYVTSVHTPFIAEMIRGEDAPPPSPANQGPQVAGAPPAPPTPQGPKPEWTNRRGPAVTGPWLEGPQGLPIFKPPYGRLVAIDLNKGEILWTVANGDGPRDHPAIKHLNLPKLGQPGRVAPLVTKTMVFLGEGGNASVVAKPEYGGGKMFRAYDKANGSILWEMDLGTGTTGAPMTYSYNGKQYIVVATGYKDVAGELIALALP
jgi:quinoprotein glucose dehydrogenase